MLAMLLLAAGATHIPTVEGRVSLLEARQMLESQQVWALRSELQPDTLRALNDVQLHVRHDQEQEDKVRDLTQTVSVLEQRLAALELLLQDRAEGTRIPVAPMQVEPLEVAPRGKKKAARAAPKKSKMAQQRAKSSARIAEVP